MGVDKMELQACQVSPRSHLAARRGSGDSAEFHNRILPSGFAVGQETRIAMSKELPINEYSPEQMMHTLTNLRSQAETW